MASVRNRILAKIIETLDDNVKSHKFSLFISHNYTASAAKIDGTDLPVKLKAPKLCITDRGVENLIDIYNQIAKCTRDFNKDDGPILSDDWTRQMVYDYHFSQQTDLLSHHLLEHTRDAGNFLSRFAKTKTYVLALEENDVRKQAALDLLDQIAILAKKSIYDSKHQNKILSATYNLFKYDPTKQPEEYKKSVNEFINLADYYQFKRIRRVIKTVLLALAAAVLIGSVIAAAIFFPPFGVAGILGLSFVALFGGWIGPVSAGFTFHYGFKTNNLFTINRSEQKLKEALSQPIQLCH